MVWRSLFRAKRINHCNDFVARVALEVVDSSWWKQQLRVKSAGSGTVLAQREMEKRGSPLVNKFRPMPLVPCGSNSHEPQWSLRNLAVLRFLPVALVSSEKCGARIAAERRLATR
jgi:hypothetical protein